MTGALLMIALAAAAPPVPVEGRADSSVRVIVYEDLQCSGLRGLPPHAR